MLGKMGSGIANIFNAIGVEVSPATSNAINILNIFAQKAIKSGATGARADQLLTLNSGGANEKTSIQTSCHGI